MSAASDIISEVDAALLAQWRRKGLNHAADVVEGYQAENQRLTDHIVQLNGEYRRVLAENQRLREKGQHVLDVFETVGFEADSPQLSALRDLCEALAGAEE